MENPSNETILVLEEVKKERERQDLKWGKNRTHTPQEWLMILGEEVGEVNRAALQSYFNYPLPGEGIDIDDLVSSTERRQARWNMEYRKELIQVAAVAVAMIESLDQST
ncbi:hypothetical protein EHQ43_08600 [Leptospira bouyouniensis]|uniref:Uncharacterized protein n=1 Tax=Leptospira bouyouniensis TaxID=2484911 RepID=A0A7I0HRV6_9LEPT|nr:MazG-like family protein [Leptospira bouyouniensis]TGL06463.1 hypothetical protein EHQ43_08600 [Leptospira bouyouniensis]